MLGNIKFNRVICFWLWMTVICTWNGYAQEIEAIPTDTIPVMLLDSVSAELIFEPAETQTLPDSTTQEAFLVADSVFLKEGLEMDKKISKPNSTKAVIYSAIVPGLGQIYNRKYWKLPLVYGGFMGFIYAITWNNQTYQDYYQAYTDIMEDARLYGLDENYSNFRDSWKDYLSRTNRENPENWVNNTTFQDQLKRKKDYFRRYRDLSIILAVGFYFICMVDAYVDAELFNFDISQDLSMRVEPVVVPQTGYTPRMVGLNWSITF